MQSQETQDAGPLPLTFDQWADISARLLYAGNDERLDTLEERGVDPAQMARCDLHYPVEMAKAVREGRGELVESYGRKCSAEMERRKAQAVPQPKAPVAAPAFEPAAPAAAPVVAPELASQPPELATFQKRESPVGRALAGTMATFDLPTAFRSGALPFKPGESSLLAAPSEPRPPPPAPRPGAAPLGATLDAPTDLSQHMRPAVPFVAAPQAPAFPRLTLQRYASLCVELAMFPDSRAGVLERYRVPSGALEPLENHWRDRFDKHPETRAEWQQFMAQYRAWLEAQR